jgi:tetratricopeptide (TPR) repeat protein
MKKPVPFKQNRNGITLPLTKFRKTMYFYLSILMKVILLAITFSIAGCANLSKSSDSNNQLSRSENPISDHHLRQILLGNMAWDNGQFRLASAFLSEAASQTKNTKLLLKAYQAAAKANDSQEAVKLAESLVNELPNDFDALTLLAVAYLHNNQKQETADILNRMVKLNSDPNKLSPKLETIKQANSIEALYDVINNNPLQDNPAFELIKIKYLEATEQVFAMIAKGKALISGHPTFVDGVLFYSKMLLQHGDADKTVKLLESILKDHPTIREYKEQLATVLYQQKNYQRSAHYYSELIIEYPLNKDYMYALGVSRYMLGEYQASIAILEKLSPLQYRESTIDYFLGYMYQMTDKDELAIKHLTQIKSGQYLEKAQYKIIDIIKERRGAEEALAYIEFSQAQYPQIQAAFELAKLETLTSLERFEEADALAQEIIKKAPFRFSVMVKHIEILIKMDSTELEYHLEQYANIDLAKITQGFVTNVAYQLNALGKTELAIQWYTDLIARSPRSSELYFHRGLIFGESEQFAKSIEDLEIVLAIVPDHFEAMNALGYLFADQNINLSQADYLLHEAYRHNPDSPAITDSLGWLYYRQNKIDDAINMLEKAFELQQLADITAHLGEVHWINGNKQKAINIWQQGLEQYPVHTLLLKTINRFHPELITSQPKRKE